ncbi:MAG: asparaginase [Synergistaceae bacterium]|nr:asparaginase [Synergistaceae bacterium]
MRFLVIATGGTIASVSTPDGLKPGLSGLQLLSRCSEILPDDSVDVIIDLFAKDSTNMSPKDWFSVAECINGHAGYFDASIVLHGTDTMSWTAAALSFMTDSVVVITGSMLPSGIEGSDADDNMNDAFAFARLLFEAGRKEVAIAFCGCLYEGTSVSKNDSHAFNPFTSWSKPLLGSREKSKHELSGFTPEKQKKSNIKLEDFIKEKHVALVPIFPGMKADYFRALLETDPKAILLEGFGSAGVPFENKDENLIPCIEEAVKKGIVVVIGTSCPSGGADPEVYEVGVRALRAGAISAGNLTREAVMIKLMLGIPICEA